MQHLEQMQRTKRKHTALEQSSTFPDEYRAQAHGGDGESGIDDLLERIEQVLRALGSSTGIEVA